MKRFFAVLIGLVFFLSGVFKLTDPVGAALVVREYLNFFHMSFLLGAAGFIGVILSLIEALTGVALITGVFRKVSAIVASVLIVLFTIITAILWGAKANFDCGCFGEVVHLTHPQTFLKNVVLLIFAAIAFLPFSSLGKGKGHKAVAFSLASVAVVALCIYSLFYIPLVEFTPFKLSSRISAAGEDDFSQPIATYIYEKDGQEGVFTLDGLPDSTWTFVRVEEMEKQDNLGTQYRPDLSVRNMAGEYCDSVAAKGRVLAVSVYEPKKLTPEKWSGISKTLSRGKDAGFVPMLIVASSPDGLAGEIDASPSDKQTLLSDAYVTDYKTAITLNRSNGGAVYLNDGVIIEKWGRRNLPEGKYLGKLARRDETDAMITASTKGRLTFQAFLLYTFAVMLFV